MRSQAQAARAVVAAGPLLAVRTVGACDEVSVHGVEPDGSLLLSLAVDSPVAAAVRRAADDLPVVVDAPDLCPDAGHLRGRVRIAGWATLAGGGPGRALLRVDVAEVHVSDPDDEPVAEIDAEDWAAATPAATALSR